MELSHRIGQIEPSATLSISEKASKLQNEGKDVVDFGAGEPDFATPEPIKNAAKQAIDNNFTHYTASSGMPELKDAIADKLERDQGLDYSDKQITVGCGAKHVLFNIMAAKLNPGDEAILFSPYWVSYPNQIRFFGGEPVVVNTEDTDFIPDFDRVRKATSSRTKLIVLNSPSNPTGTVFPESIVRTLAEFCEENDILLVSDEIYEKLRYDESDHVSPATLSEDIYDNTVLVNGVSKAYAMTGWRIGYAAGPVSLIQGINKLMGHSTSNPCSISQKAAIKALNVKDDLVKDMVDEFHERRDFVVDRLQSLDGVECLEPGGAFYVFPDVSELIESAESIRTDEDLVMSLLETVHVAPVPGSAFGAPGFLRLSYADSMDRLEEGLDRIEDWIDKNI
jgi:aspartate aminotransferase